MNIGIIGAGFMGNMHTEIFKKNSQVNIAGITGKTKERAQLLSRKHNIIYYNNYPYITCR